MDVYDFWEAVLQQDAEKMRTYFKENAYVNWHCTNEHFSVEEYIRANCEYPGAWDGRIERIETAGDLTIVVVRVFTCDKALSFHVVSFMHMEEGLISSLDEYWGDDGPTPQWRREKKIGSVIKKPEA